MAVFFFIELCSLFFCWAVSSCLWKDTQIIPEQIFEKIVLISKNICAILGTNVRTMMQQE